MSTRLLVSSIILGIGFVILVAFAIGHFEEPETGRNRSKDHSKNLGGKLRKGYICNTKSSVVMNVKKSVAAITCTGLLALGYVAGAILHFPFEDTVLLSGNIKKVKAYNKAISPEVKAEMEKLASDTLAQKQATAESVLLLSRAMQMDDLAKSTVETTKDIESLGQVNAFMKKTEVRTGNAILAMQKILEETEKVIGGEMSDDYEQARSDAFNAFMLLVKDVEKTPAVVDKFSEYLKENSSPALAEITAQWMIFAAENAIIINDKVGKTYWKAEIESVLLNTSSKDLPRAFEVILGKVVEIPVKKTGKLDIHFRELDQALVEIRGLRQEFYSVCVPEEYKNRETFRDIYSPDGNLSNILHALTFPGRLENGVLIVL